MLVIFNVEVLQLDIYNAMVWRLALNDLSVRRDRHTHTPSSPLPINLKDATVFFWCVIDVCIFLSRCCVCAVIHR